MTRLPRNVSGQDLVNALLPFGYVVVRQRGSHIRIEAVLKDQSTHQITIPNHKNLRIGTLASIIRDIASKHGMTKDDLTTKLFG